MRRLCAWSLARRGIRTRRPEVSTLARDLPRLIAAQISIHAGMTGLRIATPLLA